MLLILVTSYANAQSTYVASYRLTIDHGELVDSVSDSVELAIMPTLLHDHIQFSYHGGYYYFKIERLVYEKENKNYSRKHGLSYYSTVFYGVGTFMNNPYSIRISEYSDCVSCGNHTSYTTIWIIPMLFHTKSSIHNLRAFVFTNDGHVVKRIKEKGDVGERLASSLQN